MAAQEFDVGQILGSGRMDAKLEFEQFAFRQHPNGHPIEIDPLALRSQALVTQFRSQEQVNLTNRSVQIDEGKHQRLFFCDEILPPPPNRATVAVAPAREA